MMGNLKSDIFQVRSFHTSYFEYPWTLPPLSTSREKMECIRMTMPLSTMEIAYQAIQHANTDGDPSPSHMKKVDPILEPVWALNSSNSHDFLDIVIPSDEEILEAMIGLEQP
jgi:hypothetical protein